MTQYTPPFQNPSAFPAPPAPTERRRFPFVAGYLLWFLPALWRDAGRRWRGIGFFYLLILLALTWAAYFAKLVPGFDAFVRDDVPRMAANVPTIDIKDGVVTADVEQPYVITEPESDRPFIIIDTTGATTEPPPGQPSMLLTKTDLIVRQQGGQVQTIPLKGQTFHLDSQTVQSSAEWVRSKLWPLGFPGALVFSQLWRLVQMLIYALIGMAVASSVRPPLSFAALMRLAALAITPVILLDTLFFVLGVNLGCVWTLLGIALAIVLMVFMVRANNDPLAPTPPVGGGYFPPATMPPGYGQGTPGYPGAPQGYAAPGYAPPQQGYAAPMPPQQQGYNPPPPPPRV